MTSPICLLTSILTLLLCIAHSPRSLAADEEPMTLETEIGTWTFFPDARLGYDDAEALCNELGSGESVPMVPFLNSDRSALIASPIGARLRDLSPGNKIWTWTLFVPYPGDDGVFGVTLEPDASYDVPTSARLRVLCFLPHDQSGGINTEDKSSQATTSDTPVPPPGPQTANGGLKKEVPLP